MMLMVFKIISLTVFIILVANVAYFFLFSAAGRLFRVKISAASDKYKKIAILIPAYKEDLVILQSASDALKQNYPSGHYKVVVIADSLQPQTVMKLREIPVTVIEVNFARSTKIKSLNFAMESLHDHFDSVLVLDSDNIMSPDFLQKMNRELQSGAKAVQGHRIAKNEDNNMAFLDAISEEINNHLFRKGHYVLGFSSALIGSAMAFDFGFFKRMISGIDSVGEDKELELAIMKEKVKIKYAEDALVYDEKVQNIEVFGNQRKRWLSSQLAIFRKYFFASFTELFKNGNIDYFNKAFQSILVPRVLLLGFLSVLAVLCIFLPVYPVFYYWESLLFLYILTLMLSVPSRFYDQRMLKAILQVPSVFVKMFLLLFKLKGAGKKFEHTPHTVIEKKD
jgi:cellulose synthase/poly-beta-1,6-N-acetylglucosamine synthase-like glycosyltransferase